MTAKACRLWADRETAEEYKAAVKAKHGYLRGVFGMELKKLLKRGAKELREEAAQEKKASSDGNSAQNQGEKANPHKVQGAGHRAPTPHNGGTLDEI